MRVLVNGVMAGEKCSGADGGALLVGDFRGRNEARGIAGARGGDGRVVTDARNELRRVTRAWRAQRWAQKRTLMPEPATETRAPAPSWSFCKWMEKVWPCSATIVYRAPAGWPAPVDAEIQPIFFLARSRLPPLRLPSRICG